MLRFYIDGQPEQADDTNPIGAGGEAEILLLSSKVLGGRSVKRVLKHYFGPDSPKWAGNTPGATMKRDAVGRRMEVIDRKLREFPKGLPANAIVPLELAQRSAQARSPVIGYTMEFLEGARKLVDFVDEQYCQSIGIGDKQRGQIALTLWDIVDGCHKRGFVLGDFNIYNVMVLAAVAKMVDMDSGQFGDFVCDAYTTLYSDPKILKEVSPDPDDRGALPIKMVRQHDEMTDWWSFLQIFWELWTHESLYGGRHRPKDPKNRCAVHLRPVRGISIFHPEVTSSSAMRPLNEIGEPIVAFAKAAVLDGKREVFPRWILEELAAGRTPVAKATVAMPKPTPAMPVVVPPQPILAPKPSMANLNVQDVFHTDGTLLQVVLQEGTLRYLWFEDGRFFREGRRELLKGVALGPEWAYQIAGPGTLIAKAGNTFLLDPPAQPQKVAASLYRGQQPAFTSNGKNYFWVEGPELMRNNTRAPLRLGQVLGGQTQIWAGNSFGFGYYEAGGLNSAFIFDAETQGLKPIELPLLHGSLLSVDCVLSDRRAWVLITIKERAKVVNHCFLIKSTGELLASATADKGEDNWLGTPGGLAAGHSSTECLFVATEDGVVDVTQAGSSLQANTIYRGTEGIVRPKDRILWSQEGLYVCSGKDIRLISTR